MQQIQLFALMIMGGGTTRNMWSSFQKKINGVTLHLFGYIFEYSYGAQTHER
jgi:hypothetical protein